MSKEPKTSTTEDQEMIEWLKNEIGLMNEMPIRQAEPHITRHALRRNMLVSILRRVGGCNEN